MINTVVVVFTVLEVGLALFAMHLFEDKNSGTGNDSQRYTFSSLYISSKELIDREGVI